MTPQTHERETTVAFMEKILSNDALCSMAPGFVESTISCYQAKSRSIKPVCCNKPVPRRKKTSLKLYTGKGDRGGLQRFLAERGSN